MDSGATLLTMTTLFGGWLLGMSQVFAIDYIRGRARRKSAYDALKSDLIELRYQFALRAFTMHEFTGDISRQLLIWLNSILSEYHGPNKDLLISETFSELLKRDEKEIEDIYRNWRRKEKDVHLAKFSSSLFLYRADLIPSFPIKIQSPLFEVINRIDNLNSQIDRWWWYYTRTFDSSIKDGNRNILENNIKKFYSFYKKQCHMIVNRITIMIDKL